MSAPDPESSRLAALRRYRILDTAPEPAFDDVVRMAAELFDAPIALISLIDEKRQWFKAAIGFGIDGTDRSIAFCTHAIENRAVTVIPDAQADPRFRHNPLVTGEPGIRFYAAAPLITADGHALGAICVIDTRPRPFLSANARATLEALRRVVMAELETRRLAQQAATWSERLARLSDTAVALTRCADMTAILQLAADEALAMFEAAAAQVSISSGHGGNAAYAHVPTLAADSASAAGTWAARLAAQPVGHAAVERLDRAALSARFASAGPALPPPAETGGWMTAALRDSSGAPIGRIVVAAAGPFEQQDEALLLQFGQLLSGALANRRLLERARAAESRFRILFQSNPNPMWVFDRKTLQFLEVNDAAVELYGWSREEFRSMTVLDLRASQDVPRLLEVLDTLGDSMRHHGEWRHVNRRGETLNVLIAAYYGVEFEGHTAGLTVVHDISERKRVEQALAESEARFHNIADSVPALLWVDDPDGKTTFVNKQWLEYSGRRLEDEVQHGWQDLLHPNDRAAAVQIIGESCAKRVPYETEYRLRHNDGSYRWFLDTGSPRFSPDGTFLGFIGILLDMTDRRRLEAEIRQFQKMEAVGRLTGGIAHDFNNLLCVILGNSELIADDTRDNAYLHRLATMTRMAADRGAGLVGRLLAFSRGQPSQPVVTDINGLVITLDDMLKRTLGEDIELTLALQADLWAACVDPQQLETALLNLAINARDAMPEGGRLTIRTENMPAGGQANSDDRGEAGEHLAISVTDTGIGMTEEVAGRAFEPFYTTKEVGKGSGLGLSMVYGFAQQSHGQVTLMSEVGLGTTVKLLLPRAAAPVAAISSSADDDGEDSPTGAGKIILLVEDEELVRAMLANQLTLLGYGVVAAENGPAALALLRHRGDIDLMLTDMVMPQGLSGRQLAEAARHLRPALPVLFMSGYTDDRVALESGSLDGLPLLHKPFTKAALAEAVRLALAPRAA